LYHLVWTGYTCITWFEQVILVSSGLNRVYLYHLVWTGYTCITWFEQVILVSPGLNRLYLYHLVWTGYTCIIWFEQGILVSSGLNRLYLYHLVWTVCAFNKPFASRFIKRKLPQTRLSCIGYQKLKIFFKYRYMFILCKLLNSGHIFTCIICFSSRNGTCM
jgi:hypothetical protein